MGALTTALIAIVGVVLGWITMEIACKPCLEKGREAVDRDLNPDYDPDDAADRTIYSPLNPHPHTNPESSDNATISSTITKAV